MSQPDWIKDIIIDLSNIIGVKHTDITLDFNNNCGNNSSKQPLQKAIC